MLLALVHWTSRRGRKVLALLEVELVAALAGRVRDGQRRPLRRPHPVRGRHPRGDGDRRGVPRRLRGAPAAARRAVAGPRLRPAAVGARARAGRVRRGAAVALAARPARPRAARAPDRRGRGRAGAGGVRGADPRRRLRRADDVRLLVPRAPPGGGAAVRGGARRVGMAARAAHRDGARGADAGRLRLAARRARRRRHVGASGDAGAARPARRRCCRSTAWIRPGRTPWRPGRWSAWPRWSPASGAAPSD